MYFIAKMSWSEPVEETDEFKKKNKSFLINAESVTEAEMKIQTWSPSNYQDATVVSVTKTKISEIHINGDSEDFWKIILEDDMDGTSEKTIKTEMIYNGNNAIDIIKQANKDFLSDIVSLSKFKGIVDSDLISDTIINKNLNIELW